MDSSTRELPLTKGKIALIDAADYEWAMQWSWYYTTGGYAARGTKVSGRHQNLKLHRELLGLTDPKVLVDHINRDKLDCRRVNLRIADRAGNARNQSKQSGKLSQFKGVSRCREHRHL